MSKVYYFKVLNDYRKGGYTDYVYPPVGVWTPPVYGHLAPCVNGYHVCRPRELFKWLSRAQNIYLVEANSNSWDIIEAADKVIVRSLKLVRKLDTSKTILEKLFHYMNCYYWRFPATGLSLWSFKETMHTVSQQKRQKAMEFLMNHWGIKPLWLD